MQWLELKAPPLLLVPIVALLMWLTADVGSLYELLTPWRLVAFVLATVLGAYFAVSGLVAFRQARTTVNPQCPQKTKALVTTGVYRYTRNPMYLSFVIFLGGFAILLGSTWALLWVFGLVLYLIQFQIKPEERALQQQFSSEFTAYRQRVRRWL